MLNVQGACRLFSALLSLIKAVKASSLSLSVHVCLEHFAEALLLWENSEIFIALVCGIKSLKSEP